MIIYNKDLVRNQNPFITHLTADKGSPKEKRKFTKTLTQENKKFLRALGVKLKKN